MYCKAFIFLKIRLIIIISSSSSSCSSIDKNGEIYINLFITRFVLNVLQPNYHYQ